MVDFQPTSKQAHTNPPLRLDSAIMVRRSVDMSPIRSSVQSSRVHTPSSSVPSTPITSARAPSPEKKPLHPSDSNTFLTALAAQERRVLELKEELQKAEGELEKLKKQWASHEAAKKRNELRHLEQLQPLKTSLGAPLVPRDNDPIRDLDRRKMAPPFAKSSQRTVFSGSRHARTLSLLSPKDSLADSTLPPRSHGPPKPDRTRAGSTTVPATVHELGNSTDGLNDTDGLYRGPPKDMILETGKQLVGDFRQGLWTFFEDLKQVTVGDEAASASDPRNQPSVPAGSASKTQAKRDKGPNVKKSPAREVENVNGGKMVKSRKMESPQPHPHSLQGSHEPSDIQAGPHLESPLISTGHSPHGDTIQNSSDSDDDGCMYDSESFISKSTSRDM